MALRGMQKAPGLGLKHRLLERKTGAFNATLHAALMPCGAREVRRAAAGWWARPGRACA